ncbi:MAG: class I SAM-dependent methyltransferase [Candidatus Zapsychrus exili]|nr:class I SAM-dependent methyltransferase [Candidatus Zapsychrus exili]
MKKDKAFTDWMNFYCKQNKGLMWPNETLVRLFKGSYMPGVRKNYKGKKVLEVGFGVGNNLMFCGTLDMELFGVEVHKDICDHATKRMEELGHNADLKVGKNSKIPFKDNSFDYIVSWDVLHYEGREDLIVKAISEYSRVLKPGGRFFISTVAPKHTILRKSKTLGNHQYEIGREDDFRKGETFFYFDSKEYIKFYFSKYFSKIDVGRVTLDYFTEVNDTFIITAVNNK